ncbi:MAG: TonB-dependent receptor [Methylotenera sp.]|nr:TonB-dependent receptor [Methylotenera sp.]
MKGNSIFALSAISLALSQTVYAEENAIELDSVVVSASKIEQRIKDAPANVTVVSSKQLENGNNNVIGDALTAKVPSLYLRGGAVDGGRAGNTMQISFRGMGINRNLLLVDGQSLTDAYSGQINWSSVSMNDIERIEVIPGVGSALYGSAALGGVVSIITKKPTKREFTAKITEGFSDLSRTKIEAGYRDKFENGLGVVLNVAHDDRDGYPYEFVTLANPTAALLPSSIGVSGIRPTLTPQGVKTNIIGDKGDNASRATNANLKLFYDVSPTTQLNAGISYTDDKNITRPYHLYLINQATGQPIVLPANNTNVNLNVNGKNATLKESAFFGSNPGGQESWRYFAGIDTAVFNDSKLKVKVSKTDFDRWSSGASSTATWNAGPGTLTSSPSSRTETSAELTFPLGDNQLMVTGLAYDRATLNNKKIALANWQDIGSDIKVNTSSEGVSTTTSLFLQDQISIADKWLVYAGGRYDVWQSHGKSLDFANPALNSVNPERTENAFNPKLSAVYQFNDQLTLKSSIGTGFRAPNNYELYTNPTFSGAAAPNGKLILSNPNLEPEKSRSWDVSADMAIGHGGSLKAAYYDTTMRDMIYQKVTKVAQYTLAGTTNKIDYHGQQDNVAGARIRGFELSGDMPVSDWLSVNASYSHTNAKITSDGGANAGMVGKRLSNVPKDMASIGFELKKGDWTGIISSRYTGEIWGSADNLNTDIEKDVFGGYSKYWLTDLKIGYQINKQYKASLAVSNVFDKEYYEYYLMPGRSASVSVSAAF